MTPGRCLVTGAGGALGPAVVRALQEEWAVVRVLARRPDAVSTLLPGTEIAAGDLTQPDTIAIASRDCDAIVHLAAHLHINRPSPADIEHYERVNVAGTRAVLDAASVCGVRRVVLASTIAVYGYGRGGDLDEHTIPAPQTPYGASKLHAERLVLAARTGDGAPLGVVLRLAAVYGPRVKGNYRRLLDALAGGRFVPIGRGDNRRTLVHEDDVARAMRLATRHPAAAGGVFNITDGTCHTLAEIIDVICAALGRRPPRWSIPLGPVRAAVRTAAAGADAIGRRFAGAEMLDKYLEDVCVIGDRAQAELGFAPAWALDRGWQHVVGALRTRGELKR